MKIFSRKGYSSMKNPSRVGSCSWTRNFGYSTKYNFNSTKGYVFLSTAWTKCYRSGSWARNSGNL